MKYKTNKTRNLFHRGAQALKRYTGSDKHYACPICQQVFDESALDTKNDTKKLTLEHVPPASIGGKGIILTCKTCNSEAGAYIDAAMSNRDALAKFANFLIHGTASEAWKATLDIAGHRINVEVSEDEDNIIGMTIIDGSNDPKVINSLHAHMESLKHGFEFRITPRIRYNQRLAKIGDLKTAFLAAFAVFGYAYAFSTPLNPVRQQILNPKQQIIDGWSIKPDLAKNIAYLLLVPDPLPCLVVQFNNTAIILPTPNSTQNFYNDVAALYSEGGHIQLYGKPYQWPTKLEMESDFFIPPCS